MFFLHFLLRYFAESPVTYLINILLSARHSSANNAATYQQDAATKWELAHREQFQESNRVGRFLSRHLEDDAYSAGTSWSTPYQQDLPDLVRWWYDKCLHMEGKPFRDPKMVLEIALKTRTIGGDSTVNFSTLEKSLMDSVHDTALVQGLMNQVRRLTYMVSSQDNTALLQKVKALRTSKSTPTIGQVLQGKRSARQISTSDEEKLPRGSIILNTSGFKNEKTTEGKIRFLRSVHSEFLEKTNGDKEALDAGPKRWYNRYYKIVQCLDVHFTGDMKAFSIYHNCPSDFTASLWWCEECLGPKPPSKKRSKRTKK